jgi:hypothetical protein
LLQYITILQALHFFNTSLLVSLQASMDSGSVYGEGDVMMAAVTSVHVKG